MTAKLTHYEINYRGYQALVKANVSSTVDGAWFPSYQIRDAKVNDAIEHPQWVIGSDDLEAVLKEAERLAKAHIDTWLTA